MDIAKIILLLTEGSQLFQTIVSLVKSVKDTLSEEDAAKVEDALAEIQAKNDATYEEVRKLLAEAANRG